MKGPSSACVPLLMFSILSVHSVFGLITMEGAASYMINPTVSAVPTYLRPLGACLLAMKFPLSLR